MLTLCTQPPAPISKVKEIETRRFRPTWGLMESLCQFCPIAKTPSRSGERVEKPLKLRAKCSHANTLHATTRSHFQSKRDRDTHTWEPMESLCQFCLIAKI